MATTRRQNEFADAWVRVVPGDVNAVNTRSVTPVVSESPVKSPDPQKNTEEKQLSEKQSQQKVEAPKPVAVSEQKSSPVTSEPKQTTQTVSTPVVSNTDNIPVTVTDNEEIKQYEHMTLGNTEVFLSLYNQRNNRIVDGMVKVVDTDRSKLLKEVKGNEYLILPDPKSTSGQLSLICEAFGYRKVQQEINYPVPLADTVKDFVDLMGTTIVVNFDLIRYRVGDVTTLYHVYFYNDAALMLPESKYELNSLLQMMKENPNYRIRLHGHTNGNYHGRIITMGDNKNYFSLDGSKNSVGSAKDLSYDRAEIIRDYLGDNGVDPSRVEVKAWGGKKPLYDKHSVNAKKNVRVEVEIISE
jgi:outer membrane protein OmpA-like peptidoglycan-associated protein